jgi:hypothetical protein
MSLEKFGFTNSRVFYLKKKAKIDKKTRDKIYDDEKKAEITRIPFNDTNTFLARLFGLFEENKSSYCRHSGVSVWVGYCVKFFVESISQKLSKVSI